jgi:hypothetical protein
MYDPVSDSWSDQLIVPFDYVGGASGVILDDGTLILAEFGGTGSPSSNMASFNPNTLTFTSLNPIGKEDNHTYLEQLYILPSGDVMAVNTYTPSQFELYSPQSNDWYHNGSTVVSLTGEIRATCTACRENGPAVLRPDGKLLQFSSNNLGENALYDTTTGTW